MNSGGWFGTRLPWLGRLALAAAILLALAFAVTSPSGSRFVPGTTASATVFCAVGDFVWNDVDRDGIQDPGEQGIDGVKLTLQDYLGTDLGSLVTTVGPMNQHGFYRFIVPCGHEYTIVVDPTTLPPGFLPTLSWMGADRAVDSNGSPATFYIRLSGQVDTTIDFGYYTQCSGSIGDYVWHDLDRDGIQDGNEPGIDGAAVTLRNGSGTVIASTTTGIGPGGGHGYYQFTGLCGGDYEVSVTPPSGYTPTTPNAPGSTPENDSSNSPVVVSLPSDNATNQTIDFGFITRCSGKIGDYVWHDLDRDGIQDANEPGIDGVTLNLKDETGALLATTTTSVDGSGQHGYYLFSGLCAGRYLVEVVPPAGFSPTIVGAPGSTPANDSNPNPAPVWLPADNVGDLSIDFGFVTRCTGGIGDYVWEDLNRDGIQGASEPGINGVTLNLRRASDNSVIATTTTAYNAALDRNGYYQFTGLCGGEYLVEMVPPTGYGASPTGAGTPSTDSNPNPAPVTLSADNSVDRTIDFGVTLGRIGDFVWNDLNVNGLQDANETGLAGSTVTLFGCGPDGLAGTGDDVATGLSQTTLSNGAYLFTNLLAGCYYVTFTTPAGFTPTTPDAGDDARDSDSVAGRTGPYILEAGGTNLTIDAGFYVATGSVKIIKYTNGADANDPNAAGVPNIAPGGVVTWTYRVTNTGNTSVPRAQVVVTDNTMGVVPAYDSELSGNGDATFNPGEVWLYKATGVAVNLLLPPAGVHTVPNSCTADGTQPPRTAYTNIGTVTIPGATSSDPSSYCNSPGPNVTIIKYTNGADANDPNAAGVPSASPGSVVTWTYKVTNTGNTSVLRRGVQVTDNTPGVVPTFDSEALGNGDDVFNPGEVWWYKATGTALNLVLPPPAGVHTVPNSCTAGGTQPPRTAYTNVGTVTIPGAQATDPSSYCNPSGPAVTIVKYTNGADANDPNAAGVPIITVGGSVIWTYKVTNTGNTSIPRASVSVTDNNGVTPAYDSELSGNGDSVLDPNEIWLYKATGTAVNLLQPPPGISVTRNVCRQGDANAPGRPAYTNIGTVTMPGASATDPSSYCNPAPQIAIRKLTNGADANDPNAAGVPEIAPGATVTWTYEVTNPGTVAVPRTQITVTDSQPGVTPAYQSGDSNGDNLLQPGEVWIYTATRPAVNLLAPPPDVTVVADVCRQGDATLPGRPAYKNIGTVTVPGASATDPSSYCNPAPRIAIRKLTNGLDANDPNAAGVPEIAPNATVTWTYEVTNPGTVAVPRAQISVTDSQPGVTPAYQSGDANGDNLLQPGEIWIYTASRPAVNLQAPPPDVTVVADVCRQGNATLPGRTAYKNIGFVRVPGARASDPSSYCNPVPRIAIRKLTNGYDANDPNAAGVPVIMPNGLVIWTYEVTNPGTVPVPRDQIAVADSQPGVTPAYSYGDDGDNLLEPAEVWIYQAIGRAVNLLAPPPDVTVVADVCRQGNADLPGRTAYKNIGTVTIPGASATDPSSYCNPAPQIAIRKLTNGFDANEPNAAGVPEIVPGAMVTWTYEVTNPGTVAVPRGQISVTDSQPGVIPMYQAGDANGDNLLQPGEVWIYTASRPAVNLLAPPPDVTVVADVCRQGNANLPGRTAYKNIGFVRIPGARASDPSSYCNPPNPAVTIVKFTNGADANDPNAAGVPLVAPGSLVTWTYRVTNVGNAAVPRADVVVTDSTTGVTPVFASELTGDGDLSFEPGEVWLYTASGVALDLLLPPPPGVSVMPNVCRQGDANAPGRTAYVNLGRVTIPGASATDPSSYCNPPAPAVTIVKYTNRRDANDPNGADVPSIGAGLQVTWTYLVTNTGQVAVPRAQVVVTDSSAGVYPTFSSERSGNGDAIFNPGESWIYTATGAAYDLRYPHPGVTLVPNACTAAGTQPPRTAYTNVGTVTVPGASASDPSSYCNPPDPRVTIIKYTNGADANNPNAAGVPNIPAGDTVTWTYRVTNTGNTSIRFADVAVTDNQTGVVPAFDSEISGNLNRIFDPNEVWLYKATGPAVNLLMPPPGVITVPNSCTAAGTQPPRTAYTNIGTVTIPGASAADPSSYCNPIPAKLGDFVWNDINRDGQQNGEPGIGGVLATLLYCDGSPTGLTQVTNASGYYLFDNLAPGCYKVLFATPAGFAPTVPNVGNDATDSDPVLGVTGNYTLAAGEFNPTVDAGFYVLATCGVELTKQCAIVPPPPTSTWVCSDAKPIDSMTVIWNGTVSPIYVRAWNGSIGTGSPTLFGPIAKGDRVTFTRSGTYPNDVYFELFADAGRTVKVGTGKSTFHLSCSDVDMTDPGDCGKAAGDGKALSGYENTWIFDGMGGSGLSFSCSASDADLEWKDSCAVAPQSSPSCTTQGKPTSLTFKYVPADCSANNNPQSGKYTCTGTASGTVAVDSTNTGLSFSPATVSPGQEFTVTGSFGADTKFMIGGQTINIHTSCSQVLEVGNIFASMQLVGFNGARGGADVKYRYVVKNTSNAVLNYSLVDKVGDTIVNQYLNQTLAVGATTVFDDFVATLEAATTNVATVDGFVGAAPNQTFCRATDSVTVTVPETPPCSLVTGGLSASSKQLIWPVTNNGTSTLTVSQLIVTWPATNGALSKVKLDGDVMWDKTISCSGDLCWATLTSADLTTDTNKKSIKAGDTRNLIFEFQYNASTNLSLYSVAVNFGGDCKISYPDLPPCSGDAAVGNYVWFDADNNGIQGATEIGVNGVTLALKSLDGTVLSTTTTVDGPDGKPGYYQFTGLCTDRFYLVAMTPPLGYSAATPNAPGSTTANDSNPNPAVVKLVSGSDQTIDFGLIDGINYCPIDPPSGFTGNTGTMFVDTVPAGTPAPAGTPYAGRTFAKDVLIVRYDQAFSVNDNTYGTGSSWGHTFGNLVGSDMHQFAFLNAAGVKTLEFKIDYISADASKPSGYGSLGVLGGEGAMLVGSASMVLAARTSLDVNLNDYGYCTGGANSTCMLLTNSGPAPDTTFASTPKFNLINAYYAVVDASVVGGLTPTFDAKAQVRLISQHNSPSKSGSFDPEPCK